LLNNRLNNTDPTVAGRPLSNPQTHLHTTAVGVQPGVLYLGTHYGIFTSMDSGRTWPQQRGALNTLMITNIVVSPSKPHVVGVIGRPATSNGGQTGIYFTADGGKNWKIANAPDNLSPSAYLFTIQAGFGSADHFYAFYMFAGWFETQDRGTSWHAITSGALSSMQTPSLLADPTNSNHLLLGGDQGLYESVNDGHTWHQIAAVNGSVQNIVASHTGPRTLFCITDQGIYRWQEGSTVVTHLTNLPMSAPPTRLLLNSTGRILYGLSDSQLWYSTDSGTTWIKHGHFDQSDIVSLLIDPLNANHLYAGFFFPAALMESFDGGISWETLTD
ncbi:MAG: hypothetical protein M3Z24_07445, partial [Chloroflexota bacterium]|nr:hypothetical protein [Chloroflexota bacterium]